MPRCSRIKKYCQNTKDLLSVSSGLLVWTTGLLFPEYLHNPTSVIDPRSLLYFQTPWPFLFAALTAAPEYLNTDN